MLFKMNESFALGGDGILRYKDRMCVPDNESFDLGGDGILRYQDRMCVRDVDDLRTRIVVQAHGSLTLLS